MLLVSVLVVAGVVYATTRVYTNSRHRGVSLALRSAAIMLLFVPFLEPVLVRPDVVPDENFVAVMVDASESMSIADGQQGQARIEEATRILFEEDAGIVQHLEEHFQVRYYVFDRTAGRVDSVQTVVPDGSGTSLTSALEKVQSDLRGVPLSGVVLVTDGGDNTQGVPLNIAEQLGAADIPLHIVGVGSEAFDTEREIIDVRVSKAVEETTGAEIDVKARSWMEESGPVSFKVMQGGNEVYSERRMLKGGGRIDQFSLFFEPPTPGASEYRLVMEPAEDEINVANNEIELLVDTRKDTTRVLYFEGALRQDFKFIKRALEGDQVVDFSSVSRTGTGKYYRQGVRDEQDLAGGFPSTEAELFKYKAVILGDIEAANFSIEQMRLLERFVRVRGGGFLMLGGMNTFAEGGYWNTPVAEVLPVRIDVSRRTVIPEEFRSGEADPVDQGFRFTPTSTGNTDPILKLSPDERSNASRWASMPGLTSINYLGAVKPGAQVLAVKPEDQFGSEEPLLVSQRYGRGRSLALPTSSTWRWQMLLDSDDQRHERFWRQLVRSLAANAPERVNITIDDDHPEPDSELDIVVNTFDETFSPYRGARISAQIEDPFGSVSEISFSEDLGEEGTYSVQLRPQDEGIYTLTVQAAGESGIIGRAEKKFLVRKSRREFGDPSLKRSLLEGMAEASNGAFYNGNTADRIPERLRSRKTTTTIYESGSLWDMPLLFLLIVGILSFEWFYRRRKGLK